MVLGRDKKAQLSMAFSVTIQKFTTHTPMTVLDIVEALVFTAGHALAQKKARESLPHNQRDVRVLRELAIAQLDRGIDEGMVDRTRKEIFIPPPKEGTH